MANAFKRVANYLGLVDDEEDLQPAVEVEQLRRSVRPLASSQQESSTPAWAAPAVRVKTIPAAQAPAPAVQAELPIMDQIFTIHPRFYNEARTVGERYRQGQPVLMNLSDMDESERKRLVDFASGLVFGHFGSIERDPVFHRSNIYGYSAGRQPNVRG